MMFEPIKPFLSIIIPTFNRAQILPETLSKVLSQSFNSYEVIVVDDGSTDNTIEVCKSIDDPRLCYYRIENSERGAARNFGASQARGQYLNFFDSDDIMYANHLQIASEYIKNHVSPIIFHVGYEVINEKGFVINQEINFNYNIHKRLIKTNFLGCNSVFVRADIFAENKFNENRKLASSEDWEIWLRYASRFQILSCNEITFAIRNHENRSLFKIKTDTVIERDNALMVALFEDEKFVTYYKRSLPLFIADRFTFYALLLSLETRKHEALNYILKCLKSTMKVFLRKRFWAAIKYIILK